MCYSPVVSRGNAGGLLSAVAVPDAAPAAGCCRWVSRPPRVSGTGRGTGSLSVGGASTSQAQLGTQLFVVQRSLPNGALSPRFLGYSGESPVI
jgi:hypothetical protein